MSLQIKQLPQDKPVQLAGGVVLSLPNDVAQLDQYLTNTYPLVTSRDAPLVAAVQSLTAAAITRTVYNTTDQRISAPTDPIVASIAALFGPDPGPSAPLSQRAILAGCGGRHGFPSVVCGSVARIINSSSLWGMGAVVSSSGSINVDDLSARVGMTPTGPLADTEGRTHTPHVLFLPSVLTLGRMEPEPLQRLLAAVLGCQYCVGAVVSIESRVLLAFGVVGSQLLCVDPHVVAPLADVPFTLRNTADLDGQVLLAMVVTNDEDIVGLTRLIDTTVQSLLPVGPPVGFTSHVLTSDAGDEGAMDLDTNAGPSKQRALLF
ncbi:hypothetical protein J8273_7477 [Carpediemonas membranifera]|uniref:Uncharacterized protein n=1 Tax=Carpediemonas membranifera TaxID=201153 RepID=A0A8J6AY07_9EUKA|nr:hypothetical protein J8273_7477 [Carpediemonas membranifera]|eukprot:KAG9391203.1 hypothetical protein J8273_7477 [Carpediemonas membranifera]